MNTNNNAPAPIAPINDAAAPQRGLSVVNRLLPLWIGLAMVLGLVLGRAIPGIGEALDTVKVGETSLLIALGLLLMMYPVLAKVRYDEIGLITSDRRMIATSGDQSSDGSARRQPPCTYGSVPTRPTAPEEGDHRDDGVSVQPTQRP